MKVVKIPVGEDPQVVEFDDWDAVRKDMKGFIEPLLAVPSTGVYMYVDEDGVPKQLPMNPVATAFLKANRPGLAFYRILGTAYLVGGPEMTEDVPDHAVRQIMDMNEEWMS